MESNSSVVNCDFCNKEPSEGKVCGDCYVTIAIWVLGFILLVFLVAKSYMKETWQIIKILDIAAYSYLFLIFHLLLALTIELRAKQYRINEVSNTNFTLGGFIGYILIKRFIVTPMFVMFILAIIYLASC